MPESHVSLLLFKGLSTSLRTHVFRVRVFWYARALLPAVVAASGGTPVSLHIATFDTIVFADSPTTFRSARLTIVCILPVIVLLMPYTSAPNSSRGITTPLGIDIFIGIGISLFLRNLWTNALRQLQPFYHGDAEDLGSQACPVQLQATSRVDKSNRTPVMALPRLSSTPQACPPSLVPSDLIWTRTRRRQAIAAGSPKPEVDYGFDFPASVSRTAAKPAAAARRPSRPQAPSPPSERPACPASTVAVRSAAAATEPTLSLLGVESSDAPPATVFPAVTSPALHFRESVERYSHVHWAREQRDKPACDATIQYLLLGGPSVLPDDFLSHIPSGKRPPLSEFRSLAGKGRLHRDDDGTLLLLRKSTPAPAAGPGTPSGRAARLRNDETTRIYVPLLM